MEVHTGLRDDEPKRGVNVGSEMGRKELVVGLERESADCCAATGTPLDAASDRIVLQ
jgi:hypothetical protein